MIRLATNTGVGVVLAVAGVYGLVLSFVGACRELIQSWRSVSLWWWELAHGSITAPPTAVRASCIEAELTWVISSIVPLMILGLGVLLCRGALADWRRKTGMDSNPAANERETSMPMASRL